MIIITNTILLAQTFSYFYPVLALILILLMSLIIFIVSKSKKKPKMKDVDVDFILSLLDKSNIVNVNFIRNKIVIDFKDVELVDVELLHERGAKGVSIIGDKIKFYVDGGDQRNQDLFMKIKQFIEG